MISLPPLWVAAWCGPRFLDASLVHAPTVEAFSRELCARIVQGVGRRGKYLLVQLDGSALVLHLMMSGRIFLRPADDPVTHTRLVVVFDEGPAAALPWTRVASAGPGCCSRRRLPS